MVCGAPPPLWCTTASLAPWCTPLSGVASWCTTTSLPHQANLPLLLPDGSLHLPSLATTLTTLLQEEGEEDGLSITSLDLSYCAEISSVSPLWPAGRAGLVPDVVPRCEARLLEGRMLEEEGVLGEEGVQEGMEEVEEGRRSMETMVLLTVLMLAVLWLYVFPPPD